MIARMAGPAARVAVWLALLVAAGGLAMVTGQLGYGLLAGGLATAAWLVFLVDIPEPAAEADPALDQLGRQRDRTDRRWPA